MTRIAPLLKPLVTVLLFAIAACGAGYLAHTGLLFPPECMIVTAPVGGADTVTVALFDRVRLELAPWAKNPSERLLFRQLYETLIAIDCGGRVRPVLAESWKRRERGRCWEVTLRREARFWDGTRLTAADVVRSWQEFALVPEVIHSVIDSAVAIDDHTLHLYLAAPRKTFPRAFASLPFGVMKEPEDSAGPIGTGPYELAGVDGSRRTRRTIVIRSTGGSRPAVIRFLEQPAFDARDMIEAGIDMMVTDDPAVLEYVRGWPQLAATPLPWDRTYVLVSPARVAALLHQRLPGGVPVSFLDELAKDAVRTTARAGEPPSWWDDSSSCGWPHDFISTRTLPPADHTAPGGRRILYEKNDATAAALAARLVALAGRNQSSPGGGGELERVLPGITSRSHGVTAEAVTHEELNASLSNGSDEAYIIALPRRPADHCLVVRSIGGRAAWLAHAGLDLSDVLLPLVDTCPHLITRKGMFGVTLDWFGNIYIVAGDLEGGGVE